MEVNKKSHFLSHPAVLSSYFVLSLALLLTLIFKIWRGCLLPEGLAREQIHILRLVIYSFCFGGIGGTVYSIYGLYKHTVEQDFDPKYFYWYVLRAPLGAILGMMLYFLIQGGLIAIAQDTAKDTFQTRALLVSAAFLAGFSTNQFLSKLKELSQTIWGAKSHKIKG